MSFLDGFPKLYNHQITSPSRFHRRMDQAQRTSSSGYHRPLVNVFDGSLNINGTSVGILFVSPNKDKLRYILRIIFHASNNVAEYEACLHGIWLAVELGVKRLYVHGNSTLVINQLNNSGTQLTRKWIYIARRFANGKWFFTESSTYTWSGIRIKQQMCCQR